MGPALDLPYEIQEQARDELERASLCFKSGARGGKDANSSVEGRSTAFEGAAPLFLQGFVGLSLHV